MDKKTKLFIVAQVVVIAVFAFLALGCFGSSYTTDSYYDNYESRDYMQDTREEQKRKEEEKDREYRQYEKDRDQYNKDYYQRHGHW
ncbi:MAG: hypothetical protein IKP45_11715 [Bacteroidales bacterium]|nr:hypothetical protein [Bacteroidales bacterium]